ncbi:hypothetical protein K438DRAFT_1971226 [Mycena galopus ATCC 62051]|nr:hypothetical protein K438DRAFT_1971226 [Mycena galopus ATCC 62051]
MSSSPSPPLAQLLSARRRQDMHDGPSSLLPESTMPEGNVASGGGYNFPHNDTDAMLSVASGGGYDFYSDSNTSMLFHDLYNETAFNPAMQGDFSYCSAYSELFILSLRHPAWDTSVAEHYSGVLNDSQADSLQDILDQFPGSYSHINSSPSFDVGVLSNAQFSSPLSFETPTPPAQNGPPHLHSPQARYPISTPSTASRYGLVPASQSPATNPFISTVPIPFGGFSTENSSPPAPDIQHRGSTSPTPVGPALPPVGSMGDILRRIRTPALNAPLTAAIYIGFPLHFHPARRNFLVPNVLVGSSSPSVGDLIHALRSTSGSAAGILNEICAALDTVVFHVAWSRSLIEVHDPTYNTVANGYQEVGALRNHLHGTQVNVGIATPNDTSVCTFDVLNVAADTPLFVLYVFPLEVPSPNEPPATTQNRTFTPVVVRTAPSRAHTPTPTAGAVRMGLLTMLRQSSALDRHFNAEGLQLTALLVPKFGTAYLHIRQALIIEDIFARGGSIPHLTKADVTAWAGLRPKSYGNNLTFCELARAVLVYLRVKQDRVTSGAEVDNRALDQRDKEAKLATFLTVCFATNQLGSDWARGDGSPENLSVGGATVTDITTQLNTFRHFSLEYYKKGLFSCVPLPPIEGGVA